MYYTELPNKQACSLRFFFTFFPHTGTFSTCLLIKFDKFVLPLFPPNSITRFSKQNPAYLFIPVCLFIREFRVIRNSKENRQDSQLEVVTWYLLVRTVKCHFFWEYNGCRIFFLLLFSQSCQVTIFTYFNEIHIFYCFFFALARLCFFS